MPRATPLTFRRQYESLLRGHDGDIDLARAALLISGEVYPDIDVQDYVNTLDSMATDIHVSTAARSSPREVAAAISDYLFLRRGFAGNEDDYYDPRNSYLSQVMDRHLGIPITLSLVFMEVGRRLGLPAEGIGLPGHFIVRIDGEGEGLYVDAFHKGRLMTGRECLQAVQAMFKGRLNLRLEHLLPYSNRQILTRLLGNLKINYMRQSQLRRALGSMDLMVLTEPSVSTNYKERAGMLAQAGRHTLAAADLTKYLELAPQANDAADIQRQIRALWYTVAQAN